MNYQRLVIYLSAIFFQLEDVGAQTNGELAFYRQDVSILSDPYNNTYSNKSLHEFTGESLLLLSPTAERIIPWLTTGIETTDGGVNWTVSLRNGIVWSDGETLDTDDIRYTFDHILNSSKSQSPIAVELRARISSIEIVDDLRFIIKLRNSDMRFAHRFLAARREGSFQVLPEHVWAGNTATYSNTPLGGGFLEPLLGSGPYVVESVTATEALFVRNQDWWGAKSGFRELPEPEKLVVRFFETDEEIVEALKVGKIDFGYEVDLTTFEDIRAENSNITAWTEATPISWPGQCPRQLDFNTIDSPWNDAKLRRAVGHYIDQTEIIATIFEEENYPSPTMFSVQAGLETYIQAVTAAGHSMNSVADTVSGDVLLGEAGYTRGADGIFEKDDEDLSLTIHVANDPAVDAEVATALGEMLTASGIQTTVEIVPGEELWAWIMPPGKYESVYSWLSCASIVDPFASMHRYHPKFAVDLGVRSPGYQNMARWNTARAREYGVIVDQINTLAPGDPTIEGLVVDAYEILAEEMPFIPIVQNPKIIPISTSRWKGWPTGSNPYALPKMDWSQFQSIIHKLENAEN